MTDKDKYWKWVSENYDFQLVKLQKFCYDKGFEWDFDIFQDTILKIYDKIDKDGIEDSSDKGFDNYLFMSFQTNLKREKQYARNQKRDYNLTDELEELYESYYNEENVSVHTKLLKDLWQDFSLIYLFHKVEANFDAETFYLVRLKYLENLTYKELAELTKIKNSRQKVLDAIKWLKENVTKKEIKEAFDLRFGELIEYTLSLIHI